MLLLCLQRSKSRKFRGVDDEIFGGDRWFLVEDEAGTETRLGYWLCFVCPDRNLEDSKM